MKGSHAKQRFLKCLVLLMGFAACSNEFDATLLADDYQSSKQYGKTVALFGGSFTIYPGSELAKQYWCDYLNLALTDYGINGAGFSCLSQEHNIMSAVDDACSDESLTYDIYIFWASTNDFSKANAYAGTIDDYTDADGFLESALKTQCGGMNYCFSKVKCKNPQALILFFTSIGAFNHLGEGTDPNYLGKDGMNHFVDLQKRVCEKWNIPVLDQFDKVINENNWRDYLSSDHLHLNYDGYLAVRESQLEFIAWPYGKEE